MYVSNLDADATSDLSGTSLSNPEIDLLRAIDKGYELAASFASATLTIYLYANGSPHALLRS